MSKKLSFVNISASSVKEVWENFSGEVYCFKVFLLETLTPADTEEMITSGFDLSLYACTPGDGSRITVRCNSLSVEGLL